MTNKRVLQGPWVLSYRRKGEGRQELPVLASVPGNVELDLSRAGLLPKDLFFGENILAVRAWEDVEWWYATSFSLGVDEVDKQLELVFHAVDGDAEYYVNGQLVGTSANSLIEHIVGIGSAARAGHNELVVYLRPARPPADASELVPLWALEDPLRHESIWVRKPAHAYGWDIMPRALSAGIWRAVELVAHHGPEVSAFYPTAVVAGEDQAELRFYYELRGVQAGSGYRLAVSGHCSESSFRFEGQVNGNTGVLVGTLASPRLWWPRGYGSAELYELTVRLLSDDAIVAIRRARFGIRSVELSRQASTPTQRGDFRFVVNGTPVYCRGTNWLPLDAFHGRDAVLLASRLELLRRSNSNMVRCWGGNVYESDEFFDWCDEQGVMVWQDFSFACAMYPQTEAFSEVARHEVRSVVRRLRHHPSVVVWCGDNEVDQVVVHHGIPPGSNTLTRRVIPETLSREDPHRPYLPSSPYIGPDESAAALRSSDLSWLPEAHLWGTRDYYKSEFYRGSSAVFVSEIGFMGIPGPESLAKFLDKENLWPPENRQWLVHGTDPTVEFGSRYWWRTAMTLTCVRLFFGEVPDSLTDAVAASQIVQAEGFKYAIESGRQAKWDRTGVLWWNLVDGWPQISDAVVDWYLAEKLAFNVIAASQRPLLVLVGEPSDGRYPVLACNDTRRDVSGSLSICCVGDDKPVLEERYWSPANQTVKVAELEPLGTQSMLLARWQDDDGEAINHYLMGSPPFNLTQLRAWYEVVRSGRDESLVMKGAK